jgi:hypothetical protein
MVAASLHRRGELIVLSCHTKHVRVAALFPDARYLSECVRFASKNFLQHPPSTRQESAPKPAASRNAGFI